MAWLSHITLILFLITLSLSLPGCNSESSTADGDEASLYIGLTDAEGDFASYSVDVLSLTLTKANGTEVNVLPVSTRVDFAQYTEMTEFLTAATVPSGVYVKAKMVLDYSNADIWVEDANGDAIKVENIVDGDGLSIGQLELAVQLEGRNQLLIAPGIPVHLTLDFDLKASNTWQDNTLTVEPFLLAELELERFKTHRLRGPLKSVNVDEGSFNVIIRPFIHTIHDHTQNQFGGMKVVTTNNTVFDINGDGYQGQDGLIVLAEQPSLTAIVVVGDVKRNPLRFEAREVNAGTSVPGGDQDVVTGNVIAREGDTLTVKGATLVRIDGTVIFNDQVTVQLGEMSTVKRQLSLDDTFAIDDVSVGQRVRIFGTLTNDLPTQLELDAGLQYQGSVQMRLTTLHGAVVATVGNPEQPQPFSVDLQAIDGRNITLFDFSGTGDVLINDADPHGYEIDYGFLDITNIAEGSPVKVRGFVRPFGQAPLDFTAQTIITVPEVN